MISHHAIHVAERAKAIYSQRLQAKLEAAHLNEYVAIEPESGEHFLADSFGQAVAAARATHPDRTSFVIHIGHSAPVHLGELTAQGLRLRSRNTDESLPAGRAARPTSHVGAPQLCRWPPQGTSGDVAMFSCLPPERVAISFGQTDVSLQSDPGTRTLLLVFEVESEPTRWERSGEMLVEIRRPTTDAAKLAEARGIINRVKNAHDGWMQRLRRFLTRAPKSLEFAREQLHCKKGAMVLELLVRVADHADYVKEYDALRDVLVGHRTYSGTYEGEHRTTPPSKKTTPTDREQIAGSLPEQSQTDPSHGAQAKQSSTAAARNILEKYMRQNARRRKQ